MSRLKAPRANVELEVWRTEYLPIVGCARRTLTHFLAASLQTLESHILEKDDQINICEWCS